MDDHEAGLLERLEEHRRERIRTEGFEVIGLNAEEGDRCEYRLQQKIKGRWTHGPCGAEAITRLAFEGPRNPEGVKVPLCKRCIGRIIKDLVGYLDAD